MYPLLRSLLFQLPAETAHHLSLKALATLPAALFPQLPEGRPVEAMGLRFPNAIGLAAGLDKDGIAIDGLGRLGFGFIEIGTVTPRPQPGNPKPRLFRLKKQQAIINRMGFNNQGLAALVERAARRRYPGILGINIGKNKQTPNEQALADYLTGLEQAWPVADYITVNISSPNTRGLRDLQATDSLHQLLHGLKQRQQQLADATGRYVPVALKVAPDLEEEAVQAMAAVINEVMLDAVIPTNTTIRRPGLENEPLARETGGLSGRPLKPLADRTLATFRKHLQPELCLIGCGGISSGRDIADKAAAGARLFQLYTGFVYQGPALVRECIRAAASLPA